MSRARLADLEHGARFRSISGTGRVIEGEDALWALRNGFEADWQQGGPNVEVHLDGDHAPRMVRGGLLVEALALLLALGLSGCARQPEPQQGLVALSCHYIGHEAMATVEQLPAGDLMFWSGAKLDRTVGCPTRRGYVRTSAPECDTLGEVLDSINRRESNWRCTAEVL